MMISIIIPMFNCESYISRCINSLIDQSYCNFEIIVVDDGSTDNSYKIVQELSNVTDKIRLYKQENRGASIARNKGLDLANGEFVMFLDADDYLEKNCIQDMMKYSTYDLIMGSVNYVSKDEDFLEDYVLVDKTYNVLNNFSELISFIPFPLNKIYKKDIIDQNNLKFTDLKIGQDLNFYLKYIVHCKTIKTLNKKVANYRILDGSISRTYTKKILNIVNGYEDCLKYYTMKNSSLDLINDISIEYLKHYGYQITKINKLNDISKREAIQHFNRAAKMLKKNINKKINLKYFKVLIIYHIKVILIKIGFYRK